MDMPWGLLTVRGEYIQGTQPGISSSTASPQVAPTIATPTPITSTFVVKKGNYNNTADSTYKITTGTTAGTAPADIYNRNFNGGYIYFIQNILKTKWQVLAKYDWYDPNT